MRFVFVVPLLCMGLFAYWGFDAQGVVKTFKTSKKEAALTLDACGASKLSCGYDRELIDFLKARNIPATLFITSKWIRANPKLFAELSSNPLFDVQNHGTEHKPLSVSGKSAYNIKGTANADEIKAEVMDNHDLVKKLSGKSMSLFRSGTAHYDDESVAIVGALGYKVIGFSVNADAGATNSAETIQKEMAKTKPGDIIIAHMNHPESQNAKGLSLALKKMLDDGWKFVKVSDVVER
ncbi:MAG TPA: polysaccharide deacetylase family protein [Campylobacterales bacterium]|nr:polysaccharide deacetylase family protein [Campylobacterales bacterium]